MDAKKKFHSRPEAAAILTERGFRTKPSYLQKLASTGGGPEYVRFGKYALYTDEALDAYIERRLSKPINSASGSKSGAA